MPLITMNNGILILIRTSEKNDLNIELHNEGT